MALKLSKEKKFLLISVPLVLGLIIFLFTLDGDKEEVVTEVKKESLDEDLLAKLDGQGGVNGALQTDNRIASQADADARFSINDKDMYSEQDLWGDGNNKQSPSNNQSAPSSTTSSTTSNSSKTYKKSSGTSTKSSTTKSSVNSTNLSNNVIPVTEARKRSGNQFYTSTSANSKTTDISNINCVIHGDHKITNGQKVKIRTTQQAVFGNHIVPENTYIYGIANFSSERVNIRISSLNINNQIISQNFTVFDLDGAEGIYIPGGINQNISKDAMSNGAGRGINVTIPIIGGSINTGGVNQKINEATITIPSGYKVIIKNK